MCNFNISLELKQNQLTDLQNESGFELGNMKITNYKKSNCNKKEFSLELHQMIDNFNAISKMFHQYITTDIRGN